MSAEAIPDFRIRHTRDGRFEAVLPEGTKPIGPSMGGMLRYTYFEDFTLPPDGWEVGHREFVQRYHAKVFEDMTKNPGKFTQNPDGSWSEGGGVHSE